VLRLLTGAFVLLTAAGATALASVSPKALPLGDGHLSTTPRAGYVDSCQTRFPPGAGGAQVAGPWIDSPAGTWDRTAKISVGGDVAWPNGAWSVKVTRTARVVSTNDLPKSHGTGTFPVAQSDPAFGYDRNPNTITAQSVTFRLPLDPKAARSPACTSLGAIGILIDGVVLFNALDGEGRDAAAHEVLDSCGGHPERTGMYHHHDVPSCILDHATGRSTLVGYARDGYGIYVERDAGGNLLTNADLDTCHGRTSVVTWNGRKQRMYHYDATLEYPYTVGCYHGTPVR
jgi:hypothetical protein